MLWRHGQILAYRDLQSLDSYTSTKLISTALKWLIMRICFSMEILVKYKDNACTQLCYDCLALPPISAWRAWFVMYCQSMTNSKTYLFYPQSSGPDFYPLNRRVGRRCGTMNNQISVLSMVIQVQLSEECCNKQTRYVFRIKYWTRRRGKRKRWHIPLEAGNTDFSEYFSEYLPFQFFLLAGLGEFPCSWTWTL